jgi:SAM-dependent methyltransferase
VGEPPLINEVYDAIADDFARRNAEMPESLVVLGEELLARLPERPEVLDAGCGAGRDLAWFEVRGVRGTGCDLSGGMLRQARTRVRGRLVRADVRVLPFPDDSFDAVWCMAVLLHLPKADAPAALVELRRVLRPGGLLAVTLKRGRGEGHEAAAGGWPERFFARYQPAELATLLAEAGFQPGPISETETPVDRWLGVLATAAGRSSRGATGSP